MSIADCAIHVSQLRLIVRTSRPNPNQPHRFMISILIGTIPFALVPIERIIAILTHNDVVVVVRRLKILSDPDRHKCCSCYFDVFVASRR